MKMRTLATFNNVAEQNKPKKQAITPTAEMNYNAGSNHRAEIFKEINANPVQIDRSYITKTPYERAELQNAQSRFKRDGLHEWNERNRPGNNKTV